MHVLCSGALQRASGACRSHACALPSFVAGCLASKLPALPNAITWLPSDRCNATTSGMLCRANCTVGVGGFNSLCTDGVFSAWYSECARKGARRVGVGPAARTAACLQLFLPGEWRGRR